MLLPNRGGFFKRALGREHTRNPREVVTDRLKSYPGALREMKQKSELWRFARHRRGRWLNNRVEQDHRRIKRLTRPMLGFQGFWTAKRTLAGVEAMAMLAKGQYVPCPRVTCRRSDLLYSKSSALRPERDEAVEQRALYRQCNRSDLCYWLGKFTLSNVRQLQTC